MTLRFTLPRWFLPTEIGLGDVVKKGTAAIGVKPCAPCLQRAERLNRMLVLTPAGSRELPASPRLALPPAEGAAPVKGATLAEGRPAGSEVVHLPNDEGTPDSDTDKCCTFSVTLINRGFPYYWWWLGWLSWIWSWLWPWLQPHKVRVTAAGGTTILNADPGDWEQVPNLPNSVTWYPGTGGPIPVGDAADSWIIDNDFLLSLGPVSSGYKMIKIEWLAASGLVLDAFEVRIPCLMDGKEDESETDWEKYTSVIKGGKYTFVYLEPDDCDLGDFDYRESCNIEATPCSCFVFNGKNEYSVTYIAPSSPPCSSYQWTVDGVPQSSQTNALTVVQAGSYSVGLSGVDNFGNTLIECTTQADLKSPRPDFSWLMDAYTRSATLDASITDNSDVVIQWDWMCSNPAVTILPGITSDADFSAVADGSYDITLRVTDQCGCKWEQTQTVTVGGCVSTWEPKYSWCVEKIDPGLHKNVDVTFTSAPGGCAPYTWQWNFDDPNATSSQNTSTLPNPTHTYTDAYHGYIRNPTLTVTDSCGCKFKVSLPLTITQRERPKFTVKVCPDGKVVCETNESHPVWSATGSYNIAPWPYTKPKKHRTRIIYLYQSSGTYTITLTDTNDEGNECTGRQIITVKLDCCARNAYTRSVSTSISVQVNGKPATLRVKGKLRQSQGPLWHRVIAKTILQKLNTNGHWRRFKSPYVQLEAVFGGYVYRSEWQPLAFDGSFFKGCRCYIEAVTQKFKVLSNKKKVRAVDGLGGPFRSKFNSIKSEHGVTVNGINYPMLYLSLGQDSECDGWIWWN